MPVIEYNAVKTISRFHHSDAFVRGVRGPIGSGKSVGCCFEVFHRALKQRSFNGVRRSKWAVVRNCYDKKTELLTENGWKLFKDLAPGEKVAQLNDNGSTEFVEPTYYFKERYEGEMIGFKNEGVDFLVTPDHRMLASKVKTRKKVWGEYAFYKAQDIYNKTGYRVKRDADWVGVDPGYSVDFFKWLGFWYAAGSCGKYECKDGYTRHQCVITQNPSRTNPEELFVSANLPYTVAARPDGDCLTYRLSVTDDTKPIIEMLSKLGKSYNKFAPQWLKNAPKHHLQAFIDGFHLGNGYSKGNTRFLCTSSKQLADDFQEIALRAGLVANIALKGIAGNKTGGFNCNYDHYCITIVTPKKHRPLLKASKSQCKKDFGWYKKHYDDMVYCIEVPTHKIYVRRNGKALWCSQTYGELRSTTIQTWLDWFGDLTRIVYGHPITGFFSFPVGDGTVVECDLIFLALDKPKDVKKLKSLELTGVWINEASEVPVSILNMATGRVNRYPAKRQGGFNWSGVIMDTNSPDVDNWWYKLAEEQLPDDYEFFNQPPALLFQDKDYIPNPDAENIENHSIGYDYYFKQLPGKPKEWVDVFILNKYGNSEPTLKVYSDYSEQNHTNRVFSPEMGHIIWTHDFNFTPLSSAILQQDDNGDVFAVDEIILKSAVAKQTAYEFCERYKDYKNIPVYIYGDASGHVGEKHGHASDYMQIERILKKEGFRVRMRVPRSNGAIKDGQNSLRAKICDATGKRSLFVNPQRCKYTDRGLATVQLKEGSTFQEEDSEFQHITTAMRYYTNVEFPIAGKVTARTQTLRL
jgi:hypothetical protein